MKSKKHGIYVPDEIIDLSRTNDLILFGIETSKTLDNEDFMDALDNIIDLCHKESN